MQGLKLSVVFSPVSPRCAGYGIVVNPSGGSRPGSILDGRDPTVAPGPGIGRNQQRRRQRRELDRHDQRHDGSELRRGFARERAIRGHTPRARPTRSRGRSRPSSRLPRGGHRSSARAASHRGHYCGADDHERQHGKPQAASAGRDRRRLLARAGGGGSGARGPAAGAAFVRWRRGKRVDRRWRRKWPTEVGEVGGSAWQLAPESSW